MLGVALFVAGVAVTWTAIMQAHQGNQFTAAELLGLALVIFGGCFDPVNFVCIALPFFKRIVADSPPLKKVAWFFWGVGSLLAVAGWIGKHWLP